MFRKSVFIEVEHEGSQGSEHKYSEQYTTITYYLTSTLFSSSSSVDHTIFQLFINPRTRSCISYKSYRVLNDNSEYVQ